jgi:hypothetical protein
VGREDAGQIQSSLAVLGIGDLVAECAQHGAHRLADQRFIVDDQNSRHLSPQQFFMGVLWLIYLKNSAWSYKTMFIYRSY